MNAGLADRTTTGDLVLQQAKIVPQAQHFFDFSHGQSLLGHLVSPPARGEIPIWLSSTAIRSYSESSIQKRQYQPRFQPASFIAVRIIHIPGISIHMPGILIHILPESLFTSPRNRYSHAPEYAQGYRQNPNPLVCFLSFEYRGGAPKALLHFRVITGTDGIPRRIYLHR